MTFSSVVPYNQPRLCASSTWYPDAITFANQTTIDTYPHGIFIGDDNTIYFADYQHNRSLVWVSGTSIPQVLRFENISSYSTLFVTSNKEVYVASGSTMGQVDKWMNNDTTIESVARFNGTCFGLFIDLNNTLYCAEHDWHQVASLSLDDSANISTLVAGTGILGSTSYQLYYPWGIFVNTNFDLYVADQGNHRIQRFRAGESNGTTVAGNGIPSNLSLNQPTDVILDADGYLYIADNGNDRIVRVGLTDYQCIIGCSGSGGSSSSQLSTAYSLRFDKQANIYVTDEHNHRIQKFMLSTNSCSEYISGDRSKYG